MKFVNSVTLFTIGTAIAQTVPYFILLSYVGLSAAGQYSFYVAIAGFISTILRPQIWMYLGDEKIFRKYQSKIFKDALVQKALVLVLISSVLVITPGLSIAESLIVGVFGAAFNCNFTQAKIRFDKKYSVITTVNASSLTIKLATMIIWPCDPKGLVFAFLSIDAFIWSVAILVMAPRRRPRTYKSPHGRPWSSTYFWGWVQGLSELPISSIDRIIVGSVSLELLGIFALLKQISSALGLVSTYFSNRQFMLYMKNSAPLSHGLLPRVKPLGVSLLVAAAILIVLKSGIIAELDAPFESFLPYIVTYTVWICITVGYYHIHLGMTLTGRTKPSFKIHLVANSLYLAFIFASTTTTAVLPLLVAGLMTQQATVIFGKTAILRRSS